MKKYVVSLLAILFVPVLQTPHALAGGFVRGGFPSSGFVVGAGQRPFVSSSVIIITPGPGRLVRVSPFAREIILPHYHFVGNTVIIREPIVLLSPRIDFINEASFFDHLHQFDGLAFETIPSVIVHNGSQAFFFGI